MPLSRRSDDETLRSRIETVTSRRVVTWAIVVYLVLIFTAMMGVTRTLDQSMRGLAGRAISASLAGNVASFRLQIVQLQHDAEKQIGQDEVHDFLIGLLQGAAHEKDPVDETLAEGNSLHATERIVRPPKTTGWVALNADGEILASDHRRWVGENCKWSEENLAALRSDQATLVLPAREPMAISYPMLMVLTPLRHQNRFIGAFGWCLNPQTQLNSQLGVTQTHSTYLFDADGRILSRTRFENRFTDVAGKRESASRATRARTWQPTLLRDPGFYARSPKQISSTEIRGRPLTKMADQATRGASGADTNGYTDYRGATVVGAWQWLPDWHLGLAMEVDESSAFAAVRMLRHVVIGMFLLLSVTGLCVAALATWSGRLRKRLKERQLTGRRLGQYELTELLGAGGMGSVYRGRHQYLRRDVAIKVLEGEDLTAHAVERFRREVQLTSTLRHPNTIVIYDYGQAHHLNAEAEDAGSLDGDSVFYYVMEYIDGISLQQLIDYYGPQRPERVIHLLLQICGSIAEAHDAGLIHRDIKPGNILLSAQSNSWDYIKVLDFGLVKELGKIDDTVDMTMTRNDSITGTPLYMAPETIRDAAQASKRGDLYSIGAVGYALLTGHTTYEGDSPIDLCLKQLEGPPPRPDHRLGRALPDGLQDTLMDCLALNPAQRPRSVNELVLRLDRLPEAGHWTGADSTQWWESQFDGNRQQLPVETKNATLAGR